jgi:hypothetical protein
MTLSTPPADRRETDPPRRAALIAHHPEAKYLST